MILNRHIIALALAEQELTQSDLAKRSGISRQSISTLLARGTCTPVTAGKLAKGLCHTVQEITKED